MSETIMSKAQNGRVALVTGANKGLGREIARQLGGLGMIVFATARDQGRGQRTAHQLRNDGADVRFLQIDVTKEDSIKQAAEHIDRAFGRLDVLVNNAGTIVDEERPSKERPSTNVRATEITAAQVLRTYQVNVFGVIAVTQATLPLLRSAPAARVVNISSPLGSMALRADPDHLIAKTGLLAYSSSKAALNAVTLHYANELRGTGILVNCANPGFVATDLNTHSGPRTVEEGATIAVHLATLPDDGPTGVFVGDDGPVPW